jgi:hypothetical protein
MQTVSPRQCLWSGALLAVLWPAGAVIAAEEAPTAAQRDAVRRLAGLGCKIVVDGSYEVISVTASTQLNLPLTDDDLALLKEFPRLQLLSVRSEAMTDAGLEHLAGLKHLREASVLSLRVTEEGLDKLKAALPDCRVVGMSATTRAAFAAARAPANVVRAVDAGRFVGVGPANTRSSTPSPRTSPVALAGHFDVQAELALSREQGARIAARLRELSDQQTEFLERQRNARTPEEHGEVMVERIKLSRKLVQQDWDHVRDALSPEQFRRLQGLWWQGRGVLAIIEDDFAQALELTDEQREQIAVIARTPADRDEKLLAVLTDEQRQRRLELLGPPLDVTDEQRAAQAFVYLDDDRDGRLSATEWRSREGGSRRLFHLTGQPLIFPVTREEFLTAYAKALAAYRRGDRADDVISGNVRVVRATAPTADTFDEPPPETP